MGIAQVHPFGNQSYQNYDVFTKSKKDSSDAETEKPDISEVMKKYQEAHEITAQKLREDADWRDMTDEEWDKMLEGMDQYIDAFKERLKLQEELQEEAAKKAAAEADSAMKTTAASAAALNVAAGGSGDVVAGSGDERNEVSTGEEVKHEKNWTKLLQTDDQTILRVAKRAQEMESMAMSKYQEVMLTGENDKRCKRKDGITEYARVFKSDEDKDVWTITAFTDGEALLADETVYDIILLDISLNQNSLPTGRNSVPELPPGIMMRLLSVIRSLRKFRFHRQICLQSASILTS